MNSTCALSGARGDSHQSRRQHIQRVIAIGDIHGHSVALAQLLDDICPTEQDTLVILGDVIDRGPDSRGVIERLMDLERRCKLILLMGNHEEMLVSALQGRDDRRFWLRFGGQNTLDSYKIRSSDPNEIPTSHLRFLKQGRLYFETETHVFVHANYDPVLPLDQQSSTTLLWKMIEPADARPHVSGKVAVAGHTVFPSVLDLGFLKCIDTGCGQGGPLTALDVLSGTLFVSGDGKGQSRTDGPTEETLHESAVSTLQQRASYTRSESRDFVE